MAYSIDRAQPPLEFLAPTLNLLVLRSCQMMLPMWLQYQTKITDIQVDNVAELAALYRQFQEGKIRFLLAFRHPGADDPFCLAHLLWKVVPQEARKQGISLKYPIHAHFIYDRGIPLWAGSFVGWLNSRLGATPIQRGKIDRQGLRSARELFAHSLHPIAASPEGSKNGHNEIVSALEPGIAQMGFWCVEDLLKQGRSQEVLIIPVGIQYHYIEAPWDALEELLSQMEADCGLPPLKKSGEWGVWNDKLNKETVDYGVNSDNLNKENVISHDLYPRLYRLGTHLLFMMEDFYRRFYHQFLPTAPTGFLGNEELAERLQTLLDCALRVAEQHFNLQPKGTVIDRCRRLEQAGWDWIYREDIKDIDTLSAVERGLADRAAEEASLRLWHVRLVENFVAVTGQYVREKPTVERFAETTLLIWDTLTRIKGAYPFPRPRLGEQRVKMTVGKPISVSHRWNAYKASRKGAIASLTQDLQIALEAPVQ